MADYSPKSFSSGLVVEASSALITCISSLLTRTHSPDRDIAHYHNSLMHSA